MKKIYLLLLFVITGGITLWAQPIAVSGALTPTQIVQNVLAGQGVVISNITFNGNPGSSLNNQIGTFTQGNGSIGIGNGMILATGDINEALGPNNSGSFSLPPTADAGSDGDLNTLCSNTTFNKAVLEFDFVPAGDTIRFNYVFCSEEYNEYTCSGFNDVFGFFISGPGFSGPFSLGAENIALIPGTSTPVAINTINLGVSGAFGTPATCETANPNWDNGDNVYYVNNDNVAEPGFNNCQYDGFTVRLTAMAVVQCNQTYHLKIAVADAGDAAFDSGVMLEAGSFQSSALQISGGTIDGDSITTDSVFVEGCQQAIYFFTRPDSNAVDTIFFFTGGSATEGTDYTDVPDFIVIGQGEFRDSIIISAFDDGVNGEGTETVTIYITFDNPCGTDTIFKTLYLEDYTPMSAFMDGDTTLCPGGGPPPLLNPVVTGGFGNYHYLWYPTGDTTATINAFMGETTVYYVNIEDDCGKTIASMPVTIVIQCPIVIPNVITANEDGLNDTFIIQNIDQYPENEVWFFNRWGTLLHYAKSYKNDWTPHLSDGVYYYVVDDKVNDPFKDFFMIFKNP